MLGRPGCPDSHGHGAGQDASVARFRGSLGGLVKERMEVRADEEARTCEHTH